MIEIVEGFPANVVAVSAQGRVTRKDYEEILIPKVEEALKGHHKVRIYYELGPQFSGMNPGAAWEDFKLGIGHLSRWDRMAVVTDVAWIRHTTNAFRFLMPGEVKIFRTDQSSEARTWIAAG